MWVCPLDEGQERAIGKGVEGWGALPVMAIRAKEGVRGRHTKAAMMTPMAHATAAQAVT